MIQMTAQTRILVAVEAVDFRKGIDGLCGICRHLMREDPFKGCVFVFRNRRGTSIKLLTYDGQGFWLCQKRLSTGRFQWWPERQDDRLCPLAVHELQLLLWSGNPKDVRVAPVWRRVEPTASESFFSRDAEKACVQDRHRLHCTACRHYLPTEDVR